MKYREIGARAREVWIRGYRVYLTSALRKKGFTVRLGVPSWVPVTRSGVAPTRAPREASGSTGG